MGSHSLLQEIFPIQELNPGLHIAGRFFTIWATRETQYADDTFLMAESEDELKSLLKRMKKERERAGLKTKYLKS